MFKTLNKLGRAKKICDTLVFDQQGVPCRVLNRPIRVDDAVMSVSYYKRKYLKTNEKLYEKSLKKLYSDNQKEKDEINVDNLEYEAPEKIDLTHRFFSRFSKEQQNDLLLYFTTQYRSKNIINQPDAYLINKINGEVIPIQLKTRHKNFENVDEVIRYLDPMAARYKNCMLEVATADNQIFNKLANVVFNDNAKYSMIKLRCTPILYNEYSNSSPILYNVLAPDPIFEDLKRVVTDERSNNIETEMRPFQTKLNELDGSYDKYGSKNTESHEIKTLLRSSSEY